MSLVVERRAVRHRLARAVGLIVIEVAVKSVVDVGGTVGVDVMSRVDAEASVRMRRVPKRCRRSIVRSRAGWIRRRL